MPSLNAEGKILCVEGYEEPSQINLNTPSAYWG